MFAAAAKEIGLVDECCTVTSKSEAENRVMAEAVHVANEICNGGPIAVLQALKAVESWQEGEKAENAAYEAVLGTSDRLEALQAFAEKRKPSFKGE
jgi:methylglutaconyl-CoA hydratase